MAEAQGPLPCLRNGVRSLCPVIRRGRGLTPCEHEAHDDPRYNARYCLPFGMVGCPLNQHGKLLRVCDGIDESLGLIRRCCTYPKTSKVSGMVSMRT